MKPLLYHIGKERGRTLLQIYIAGIILMMEKREHFTILGEFNLTFLRCAVHIPYPVRAEMKL
jgi:hypothetical protein